LARTDFQPERYYLIHRQPGARGVLATSVSIWGLELAKRAMRSRSLT
jgi:hypothetical protein